MSEHAPLTDAERERTFTAAEVIEIANETSDSLGNLYRLDFIDRIQHEAAARTATADTHYEYVVWDNIENWIHRGPWDDEYKAVEWIEECKEMFTNAKPGAIDKLWSVRRRAVGEWVEND
jgi:hypothetical protein